MIDTNSEDYTRLYDRYRVQVIGLPGVLGVAGTSVTLGEGANYYKSKEPELEMFHASVTLEFVSTFGLRIVQGHDLRPDGPLGEVLVNQKMVEAMGWDNPIGQTVPIVVGNVDHPSVVGVIEDFIYMHAAVPMHPFVAYQDPEFHKGRVWVRLDPSHMGALVPQLETIWKDTAPEAPSSLHLLSDNITQMDEIVQTLSQSLGYAASIFGIVISCLGIFGLALHTLALRTKEVAVRKVLGASVSSIFVQLSRRLILLSIVGCVLGSIGSYFLVQVLMQEFAHRMPLSIYHFAVPSLTLVVLALLSVCYHTLRTARTDPAKELKYE